MTTNPPTTVSANTLDSAKLYVPVICDSTKTLGNPNKRVLLMGDPGSGKSTAMLTFPNLIVCEFDNQIQKFNDRDIPFIPFYDKDIIDKKFKTSVTCQALLKFIKDEASKFSGEQTLGIDSLTTLNNAVHGYYWAICPMSKKDPTEKDGFWFWDMVKDYYIELHVALLKLKCRVVVCAHLGEDKDKDGRIIGYKPLVEGSFKQMMGLYYTDVFKQLGREKQSGVGNSTTIVSEYVWQIRSGGFVQCKTTIKTDKMYVPASYESFL